MSAIDATLPPELEGPIAERLRAAAEEDVARRIWRKDATLWAPEGTPEVANRLGWLTIADRMLEEAGALREFAAQVGDAGLTDCVLLGMGGSSLAPEVFRRSYGERDGGLKLHVLDSTEPLQIAAVRDAIDLEHTLFLVSTKSGGTVETRTLFEYFHALRPHGEQFVAITDPGSSLLELAEEHGFRRTFVNDPDIGGRYSALSYFGLVPAVLAGVDVEAVLQASADAERSCAESQQPDANPGLWLGVALGALALRGRDKLTFVVDAPVAAFGVWVEQLVAESTGKEGKGILPIADEPLAERPEAYGTDRVFVHVRNASSPDADYEAKLAALAQAGHPTFTLPVEGADDLGRLFFLTEFATAVAGWALGINPFDQPNVQEAKDNTERVLEEGSPSELDEGDVSELLGDGLAPPSYVAIMGYLPYSDRVDEAVSRLRRRILESSGVATTFGYGPRFLHSTGQLHKGGPKTGRFLQLVHDSDADLPLPERPFGGFRTLISAQADGDLQTIRSHGLPAARVRLDAADLAASIDALSERI